MDAQSCLEADTEGHKLGDSTVDELKELTNETGRGCSADMKQQQVEALQQQAQAITLKALDMQAFKT